MGGAYNEWLVSINWAFPPGLTRGESESEQSERIPTACAQDPPPPASTSMHSNIYKDKERSTSWCHVRWPPDSPPLPLSAIYPRVYCVCYPEADPKVRN